MDDLAKVAKFSTEPMKRLTVKYSSDESTFFEADIKSVKHPKVKTHYDGLTNRLVKLSQEGGKKTPKYTETAQQGAKDLVHLIMDGSWDLKHNGQDWPNTRENREILMGWFPGIAEDIKEVAEKDTNFFDTPTAPPNTEQASTASPQT